MQETFHGPYPGPELKLTLFINENASGISYENGVKSGIHWISGAFF
jgi:hypothetical protein